MNPQKNPRSREISIPLSHNSPPYLHPSPRWRFMTEMSEHFPPGPVFQQSGCLFVFCLQVFFSFFGCCFGIVEE